MILMILVVAMDVMKMRKRSMAVSLSVVTGNGRVCVGISWQESDDDNEEDNNEDNDVGWDVSRLGLLEFEQPTVEEVMNNRLRC